MEQVNKSEQQINIHYTDLANLFNVYNDDNQAVYNICRTIQFDGLDNISEQYYGLYKVVNNDTWPLISYKLYGTVRLWWLVCKFNNVVNPTVLPEPYTIVYYPKKELVDSILSQLKSQ